MTPEIQEFYAEIERLTGDLSAPSAELEQRLAGLRKVGGSSEHSNAARAVAKELKRRSAFVPVERRNGPRHNVGRGW